MSILVKLAKGQVVTEKDIIEALYETCDQHHASCCAECPVYEMNGGPVLPKQSRAGCQCFKNGEAMLKFIREKI